MKKDRYKRIFVPVCKNELMNIFLCKVSMIVEIPFPVEKEVLNNVLRSKCPLRTPYEFVTSQLYFSR